MDISTLQLINYIINGIVLIIGIGFIIFGIYLIYTRTKNKIQDNPEVLPDNDMSRIEKIKIITQEKGKAVDDINELIDKFITDAANIYIIMELGKDTGINYLNSAGINTMTTYIYGTVIRNMSDRVVDTIKLIYNVKNKEDLDNILNIRIKLYMINFTIDYNKQQ